MEIWDRMRCPNALGLARLSQQSGLSVGSERARNRHAQAKMHGRRFGATGGRAHREGGRGDWNGDVGCGMMKVSIIRGAPPPTLKRRCRRRHHSS